MSGLHGPHDQGPSHLSMPFNSLQPPHIIPQASGSLHIQISMAGSFVLLFFSPEIYTFVPKALGTFLRSPLLKRPFLPTYQNLQILKQFT